MNEKALNELLTFEKILFDKSRSVDSTENNEEEESFRSSIDSLQSCSKEVISVYINFNNIIEELLHHDNREAKFRLRHAVINNNLLFVAIFLRHCGDVNLMDENQQSLIHWSTTAAMIHLLLSYGANLYHLASSGRSALHSCNTVEAAEALIVAGISPNVLNRNRGSPLHNGFISTGMTRLLLKYGANPNIINYYGHTPLHVVSSRGTWEVVYYLLCGGCDCSIVGLDGMSAISLARMVKCNVLQGGDQDKIDIPLQEFVRLDKTIELLFCWQSHLQEGKTFQETKYLVSKHLSWKAQALLCKDPLKGYREAMKNLVPEDIINEIIVHFVGPEGPKVNSYSKFNNMASFRQKKRSFAQRSSVVYRALRGAAASWAGSLQDHLLAPHALVVAVAMIAIILAVSLLPLRSVQSVVNRMTQFLDWHRVEKQCD